MFSLSSQPTVKKPVILMDALFLGARPSGSKTYIMTLLRSLLSLPEPEFRLILFYSASFNDDPLLLSLKETPWIELRSIAGEGILFRALFSTFIMPFIAWRCKANLLHSTATYGPSFRLPWHRCIYLLTVNDVYHYTIPNAVPRLTRLAMHIFWGLSIRRADHLISISESTKADLMKYYSLSKEKITAIPLATVPQFSSTEQPILPSLLNEKFIFTVGALKPHKGFSDLIKAFSQLPHSTYSVPIHLVIAGSGEDELHLSKLITELLPKGRGHLIGRVSESRLRWYYEHALIFVMPSLYEGFGLPLLEAMQSGTVCVARQTASLPEVLGDAGLYFNTIEELCRALDTLIKDAPLRMQLGTDGQRRARTFSETRLSLATHLLYQALLSSSQPNERIN